MGKDIYLTISRGVQKAKNANCERRVKPNCYISHIGITDLPGTQLLAGISLAGRGTKCRH